MVSSGGINSCDLMDIQSVAWQLQTEFKMAYLPLNISMRPRGGSRGSRRRHFTIAINIAILNRLTGQDVPIRKTKFFFGAREWK